jgi:hypothetical protein
VGQLRYGIDWVPALRYGFTEEELDFIPSTKLRTGINYDIQYRMRRKTESDDLESDADQ